VKYGTVVAAVCAALLWNAATFGQTPAQLAAPSRASVELARQSEFLRARWAELAARGLTPATIVEPSLGASKILTPSINLGEAPGAPIVQLALNAGTVGYYALFASLISPSGSHEVGVGLEVPALPTNPEKRQFVVLLQSPFTSGEGFNIYSEAGVWTLQSINLSSNDGQLISYSGSQLASLFPGLTVNVVNKGTPDITPPKAGKGKILTPTVSLGSTAPYFAARLPVSDSNSGVQSVSLSIIPPGSNFPSNSAYSPLAAPVKAGDVTAYATFNASSPTGTYTISAFQVCDYAGNCLYKTSAADIEAAFGASSFEVTQ
jgi:hypothetical protein